MKRPWLELCNVKQWTMWILHKRLTMTVGFGVTRHHSSRIRNRDTLLPAVWDFHSALVSSDTLPLCNDNIVLFDIFTLH